MAAPACRVEIAERANPRRSFLLVSTVLGKHLPVPVALCRLAGTALGLLLAGDARASRARSILRARDVKAAAALLREVADRPADIGTPVTVIGMAETATALGHQVAETLAAEWYQTTSRQSDARYGLHFREPHSHAADQWLLPPPNGWPDGLGVIVDDEVTTGATAAGLITAMHDAQPRSEWVVACLVDSRGRNHALHSTAVRLGVSIRLVALDALPAVRELSAGWSAGSLPKPATKTGDGPILDLSLASRAPRPLAGLGPTDRARLCEDALDAGALLGPLPAGTLVLGTGEHLAFPQLAALAHSPEVHVAATTRTPALVTARADYPLRSGLAYASDDSLRPLRYAYNVEPASRPCIVVHFETHAARSAHEGLVDALAASGATDLRILTLGGRPA